jgi:hypothetical protein
MYMLMHVMCRVPVIDTVSFFAGEALSVFILVTGVCALLRLKGGGCRWGRVFFVYISA